MISRKELAEHLQVNYWTIQRWDKQNKIPKIKAGKQYRYDLEEVKRALSTK